MDIQFQFHHVNEALLLMLCGMVGIFVVMAIIMGIVYALNKITGEKKPKKPDSGQKQ